MVNPSRSPDPPEGLIIDLVTPLTGDGGLDATGLDRLLARVLPAADGLLAGSPLAGEALDLPMKTRQELFTHLLSRVADQVPLFFGITGNTLEETRELAAWSGQKAGAHPTRGPSSWRTR